MNIAIYKSLLKATLKICIAGVFIGLLHTHHKIIATILCAKVIHSMYSLGFKDGKKYWAVPIGMFTTGALGILAEYWGTYNNYWKYHDVAVEMPYWLPFAWMLAFSYIYKLEKEIFAELPNPSLKNKIITTFLLVLIFPAFGEVITINLGVWTYYWPFKIFGVPVYAFLCLLALHSLINYSIYLIVKKRNIKDPVFN